MKNKKHTKKAAPKTAKKVEKTAVAAKKVVPSKPTSNSAPVKKQETQKPNTEVTKVTREFDVFKRQALNEIEDYKMTVGKLEEMICDLKQKNAKLRKKLADLKEEKRDLETKKLIGGSEPKDSILKKASAVTGSCQCATCQCDKHSEDNGSTGSSTLIAGAKVPSVRIVNGNCIKAVSTGSSLAFLKKASPAVY